MEIEKKGRHRGQKEQRGQKKVKQNMEIETTSNPPNGWVMTFSEPDLLTKMYERCNVKRDSVSLPIAVTIGHRGFWITVDGKHKSTEDKSCNRNSVMLHPMSLPYIYKIALRHLLLSMHIITPYDIDAANLVPHVKIRKDVNDAFSQYENIQGEQFVIGETEVSVKSDFITIELDTRRDLHTTLVFSKKIKQRVDLLAAFRFIIQLLNTYPELIERYSQLDNFGGFNTNFWYENDGYPFNVELPFGYTQVVVEKPKFVVSPGGSILNHI